MLERAFSLLEALGSDGTSVGLAELARRAGLPKATAYRLANQLIDLHVLERAGQEYQLGLKLFELGNSVARQRELREAALPFMEDLYEATHETIHLGVLDETEVLYVEKIAGRRRCTGPPGYLHSSVVSCAEVRDEDLTTWAEALAASGAPPRRTCGYR